jgi:polyadenylation factor subunit 2
MAKGLAIVTLLQSRIEYRSKFSLRFVASSYSSSTTLLNFIVIFSFELIMSAHDTSFRSMAWSHNRNYLLTSDAAGNIKYWSPSIAPVQSIDSHNGQAIHSLSFSPSDTKFVSCGDDATVRIWDWATHSEERVLEGHGWGKFFNLRSFL